MKEKPTLAERILTLKFGQSFIVKTSPGRLEIERAAACRIIKSLRDAGTLNHDVKTTTCASGFKIYAI